MINLRRINQSKAIKNTSILMAGSLITQIIIFCLTPIITRIYTPQVFGEWALIQSVFIPISGVVTLSLQPAILLPRKNRDSIGVFLSGCVVALVISSILLLTILVYSKIFELKTGFILGVFIALGLSFHDLLNAVSNRFKLYSQIAITQIFSGVGTSVMHIALGNFSEHVISLIVGRLFAIYLSIGYLGKKIVKIIPRNWIYRFSLKKAKKIIVKFKKFPLYIMPTNLLDQISLQLPLLIGAYHFSSEVIGIWALTTRVLVAPTNIIGSAVGQVAFKQITSLYANNKKEAKKKLWNWFLGLCLFSIFFSLLVYTTGPYIFKNLFGNEWEDAGKLAKILVIAIGVRLIVSPLSSTLFVTGDIMLASVWKIIYFISSTIVLTVSGMSGFTAYCKCYILNEIAMYILYLCFIIYGISKKKVGKY